MKFQSCLQSHIIGASPQVKAPTHNTKSTPKWSRGEIPEPASPQRKRNPRPKKETSWRETALASVLIFISRGFQLAPILRISLALVLIDKYGHDLDAFQHSVEFQVMREVIMIWLIKIYLDILNNSQVLSDLGLSDKAATIDLRQLSLLINDEIIQSQV